MPSTKRLSGVCHNIAHHAMSGLSSVLPDVARACRSVGSNCIEIDLMNDNPCPEEFCDVEPLYLSLGALREKFVDILTKDGFTLSDVESMKLTFHFYDTYPYDSVVFPFNRRDFLGLHPGLYYYAVCEAKLSSTDGKSFRHIGDYGSGRPREPDHGLHSDCL